MFNMIWPIALIVLSNTVYQICAKSIPSNTGPFAPLAITYGVSTVFCIAMHYIMSPKVSIIKEIAAMNWAPYVLGIVIVGLEAGWIYAYRAGWQVSTGFIVQSAILAVVLFFVGFLLYHEPASWNKIVGIAICLIGLGFINIK